MSGLKMFLPITKVDAETRTVYGIATGETADRSGEVCDYASTKPLYEEWSGDISKASGGKSLGNLRAMHGKVAAGKVTAISFNDGAKQIEIAAKVVDDNEWQKCLEGVYTGFSQGGSYQKRWKGEDGLQRYTAAPSEVSLVDLPCLPTATFELIKAAGVVETKHFAEAVQAKEPSVNEVAAKADELAKAASNPDWSTFIPAAREALMKTVLPSPEPLDVAPAPAPASSPREGDDFAQVWLSKRDSSTHATKAAMLAHHAALDDPATKAVQDQLGALNAALGITKADDKPWTVSSKDGDGKSKTTSHSSKDAATAEANSRDKAGHKDIAMTGDDGKQAAWKADKAAPTQDLDKRGARNSSADQSKIQAMHDHACSLGASCDADNCGGDEGDDAEKKAARRDLAKAATDLQKMQVDLDAANARADGLSKTIASMAPMLEKISAEVAIIKNQPVPLALADGSRIVSKGGPVVNLPDGMDDLQKLALENPEQFAIELVKLAQRTPRQMQHAR